MEKEKTMNAPVETEIVSDEQAIMALQRVSTGADVHETNSLILAYRLYCLAGHSEGAEQAKRNMYRRTRQLMRRAGKWQAS